ncbi:MAG: thermonuclease family protein [Caldilineaceae bacterium]
MNRRTVFVTGFIVIVAAIFIFFLFQSRKYQASPLESCGDPRKVSTAYTMMSGSAVEVINGDTFILADEFGAKKRVHLTGINAPALSEPVGIQSKQHLSDTLLNLRVTISSVNADDLQKESVIALVSTHNEDLSSVNLEQLKSGFAAYVEAGMDLDSYQSCTYKNAEQEAKINKLGIWLPR